MELLVRIEKVLERTHIRRTVYTALEVTIDAENHTVTVQSVPVEMKPMEFALMTMLAKHQSMAFFGTSCCTRYGEMIILEKRA